MTDVDFWFDPGCPWTWLTSRWMTEVAAARDLDVRWRTFSLLVKNGGAEAIPERFREHAVFGHGALRVIEAARNEDEALVGRLYTEYGRRLHHKTGPADHADVLRAVGADPGLAEASDDTSLDATIDASMKEVADLVGDDVGVPVLGLAVDGGRCGLSGPVVSPVPTGEDAVRLFDAVVALTSLSGFYELKRTRRTGPQMPDTPSLP